MTTSFAAHLLDGTHAARPAATAVPDGTLYSCSDHSLVYQSDGAVWATWASLGGVETLPESIIDAAGDLIIGDGADSAVRLPRGTDGQALRATATTAAYEDDFYILAFFIDGGGSVITTGRKLPSKAPMAGVIVEARCVLDQSGSISVDIWKDSPANWPPVDADSITASAPVAVSGATNSTDTTLTGWGTTVAVGDEFIPNVDSVATATWAAIFLKVRKT